MFYFVLILNQSKKFKILLTSKKIKKPKIKPKKISINQCCKERKLKRAMKKVKIKEIKPNFKFLEIKANDKEKEIVVCEEGKLSKERPCGLG